MKGALITAKGLRRKVAADNEITALGGKSPLSVFDGVLPCSNALHDDFWTVVGAGGDGLVNVWVFDQLKFQPAITLFCGKLFPCSVVQPPLADHGREYRNI